MARVNKNTKPQYHHLPVAMIDTPVDKENTRERSRGLTVVSIQPFRETISFSLTIEWLWYSDTEFLYLTFLI